MRSCTMLLRLLPAACLALTSACSAAPSSSLPPGLTLEEHALLEAPTLDPLAFRPVAGSMDAILARRLAQRSKGFADSSAFVDGRFSLRTSIGADTLVATENYSSDGTSGWVTLTRNGQEIYRVDTGMASPVTSLRGLWSYADHWVLETAHITPDAFSGQLSRDGEKLSARYGYQEAFGFQLLHGNPFYFFRKNGKIGFSYDGREVAAGYAEIPHYGCCSASELNPHQAQDMIAFFARRDRTWYYVEIGVFG